MNTLFHGTILLGSTILPLPLRNVFGISMCKLTNYIAVFALVFSTQGFLYAQTIVDPCFDSSTPGHPFPSSGDLFNTRSSDLCEWNGAAWVGPWSHANVNMAPPPICTAPIGVRAVWTGASSGWTTGGEAFAFRLTAGLVAGNSYTFDFTTVSHGNSSTGSFAPNIYTNTSGSVTGAYLMGQITSVGTTWATNAYTFTASAGQAGDNWIIIHTNTVTGSGMTLDFCSCPIALPITMQDFTVDCADNNVSIDWITASEYNNDFFTIERSSDGENFEEIGTVQSMGTSITPQTYSWIDETRLIGTTYYRLSQTDVNGTAEDLEIRSLNCGVTELVSCYPNPFTNQLNVSAQYDGTITLIDIYGKQVLAERFKAGKSVIRINNIATGAYFGHIVLSNGKTKQIKLIKL